MTDILPPVTNLTLEKRVYKELLQAIIIGKLKPGSQVTIAELAHQLGVSLMPVRQALKALEAKNLIYIQKNRRLIIRDLSIDDLYEIFQMRIVLEQMAAKEAVKNCSTKTIQKLKHLLKEMNETDDIEVYIMKNQDFHHTIYKSANKPILFKVIQDLWFLISPYMYLYLIIETVKQHDPFHEKMVQGMQNRDFETVAKWLKRDLKKAAEELRYKLLQRSL